MTSPAQTYVARIQDTLRTAAATEHSYRPALKDFLEALGSGLQVVNEPKHRTDCGAPDMVVHRRRGRLVIGHVEAKDVGVPLADVERSEQLARYRRYLPNLLLTDYVRFRWYVEGELRAEASVGTFDASAGKLRSSGGQQEQVAALLSDFLARTPEPISRPRDLAERLARLTHMIRDIVVQAFQRRTASDLLRDLRQLLADSLIPDLLDDESTPQFADLYAQTLTYGLFAARCHHMQTAGASEFTLHEAAAEIPRTNPLLRQLFSNITGPDFEHEPYASFVTELVAVLDNTEIGEVLEDFGRAPVRQDPVLHFYETFLATYDPELRERRGVYYTPEPVVSYIVRSVDELLRSRFNIRDGLADTGRLSGHAEETHRTLILDPAAGTGTFLYEVVETIRERFRQGGRSGLWNEYVRAHLLPRLFGFELLMAPYAMAHLKLGMQLAGQDLPAEQRGLFAYGFDADDRLQVYLTNTLEQVERHAQRALGSLQRAISEEAAQAARVKRDLPILVVLGNPPYSGISSNQGAWIDGLLKGTLPNGTATSSYYHVDGEPLGERNPKWLQDDYVKFIRWAQWRLEQTGCGILAFITNHSYLDNPTFRGMRWCLMHAFDEIYVLDLHGSTKKKEVPPDGSADHNVFDIQQGVAIGIFVKRGRKRDEGRPASVHHADLWGPRERKYEWLAEHSLEETDWEELEPAEPFYLFKPFDSSETGEYYQWASVHDVMPVSSVGIVTARDKLTIQWSPDEIWDVVREFARLEPEPARERFNLGKDVVDWKVATAQKDIQKSGLDKSRIRKVLYRPFDTRWTYYTGTSRGFICRPRADTIPHMLAGENTGLIATRQTRDQWGAFVSRTIIGHKTCSAYDINSLFPLYLYPGVGKRPPEMFENWPAGKDGRRPNLDPVFVGALEGETGLSFVPDGRGDLDATFGPEDVLAYIYAVFHSPEYRRRFEPMLKLDFPRVPPPDDAGGFAAYMRIGHALLAAHLLEDEEITGGSVGFPVGGDNTVAKGYPVYVPPGAGEVRKGKARLEPDAAAGRVYLNPEQYFEGVEPEVWEFQIGGYQVCEKWLKDRRGRKLDYDDLEHYGRIVESLRRTIALMGELERLPLPGEGGAP